MLQKSEKTILLQRQHLLHIEFLSISIAIDRYVSSRMLSLFSHTNRCEMCTIATLITLVYIMYVNTSFVRHKTNSYDFFKKINQFQSNDFFESYFRFTWTFSIRSSNGIYCLFG